MAKIVTAVFEDASNAQVAVQDLVNHGIVRQDISVQATQSCNGREFCFDITSKAPECGVIGTILGITLAAAGAYLISTGYITVPIANLAHHNLLLCTLAGAAVGAVCGMMLGLTIGSMIPEYECNLYPTDERKNTILLGVYCSEKRESEVKTLLQASSGALLRSKSVATQPIKLYTTSMDRSKPDFGDDLISRAVLASEGALTLKRLQAAKSNLSKIMESIAQLESELQPKLPQTPTQPCITPCQDTEACA